MSFGRRTWDREEYEAKASSSFETSESNLSSLDEDQLRALKQRYTDYNLLLEYNLRDINKKTLSANVSQYKKGKQFGFYCELCDLTFKDTLQFINHLNHKSHIIRFENVFNEPLIQDMRDNDSVPTSELRSRYHKDVSLFIKQNALTGNKPKGTKKPKTAPLVNESVDKKQELSDMERVMGFSKFGALKK